MNFQVENMTQQEVFDKLKQMGYKLANLSTKLASKKLSPKDMKHTVFVGGVVGMKHFVVVKDDGSWYQIWINAAGDQYGYWPALISNYCNLDRLKFFWMAD